LTKSLKVLTRTMAKIRATLSHEAARGNTFIINCFSLYPLYLCVNFFYKFISIYMSLIVSKQRLH